MLKKYKSLEEAKVGMDKFAVDIEHFEKEIRFLKSQLESKQEMLEFVKHQRDLAEDAAIDFELNDWINWNE